MIVELKFNVNSKSFFADVTNFDLKKGDMVVAIYSDCKCLAEVLKEPKEQEIENKDDLTEIVKKATAEDLKTQKTPEQNDDAFKKVQDAIEKFGLKMKLVDVQFSFDQTKLFVTYSAEARVDFRELVKNLANIFRTRVELRQISFREEAKMLGGCGVCGKPFCCGTFLSNTPQTTIKMAKTQGLALNPNKVNGACGKLLCCIAFEHPEYEKVLEKLPPLGSMVKTAYGDGEVVFQDLLKEKVSVKVFDSKQNYEIYDLSLDELKEN